MTVEDRTAPSAAEPLFTTARSATAAPYGATAADPWASADEERDPAVRLSLVETVMEELGGPVVELGTAPAAFIPPPPATLGASHRRKGMVRSFREWWRQESLARAAQKQAFAMAETILRSQAAQLASGSGQDRVRDELSAISRSLEEVRGQISELIAVQRSG